MDPTLWNALVFRLPNPHFLQTYEWGQVKAMYGWSPLYALWNSDGKFSAYKDTSPSYLDLEGSVAAALILKRQILNRGFTKRLSILYSPKGPLFDWTNESLRKQVLNDLQTFAKEQGAIFLKMDPDVVLGTGVPGMDGLENSTGLSVMSALESRGWKYSADQIQFRNTVLIDLTAPEEELLSRMKQKTRYNIRLAEKKGVVLRVGTENDWQALYRMYAETSVRDGFVIRDEGYYKTVWQVFMQANDEESERFNAATLRPSCEPLVAEVHGEPVAAIFVFYFAGRAFYVYGMSRNTHREKMPTYLLQWEAIKRAKAKGCSVYDLWGAPEVFDESDSLWGVYRFKQGLGGQAVRTLGAWDYAPSLLWYKMYSEIIPRLLDVMRTRGQARTKQNVSV